MINQPSSAAKIPPFAQPLTQLERFSTVAKLTTKIKDLNNSPKHTFLGPLAARVMGVALITFAIITDFVVHLALAIGKAASVPFAQPFRCCVKTFPRDLHFSSPITHIVQTIRTLSYIAIFLPVLCLLDPDRAYQITRIAGDTEDEINYLKAQKEILENANHAFQMNSAEQQATIDRLEREKNRLEGSQSNRRDLVEQMTGENNQLKLQIAKSEDEVKNFKEQMQTNEQRVDQLIKDKSVLEGRVTTLKDSLSSDQKKLIENHDQQLAQLNDQIKKITEEKSKIESDVSGKNQENETSLKKLNDEKKAIEQQRDQLQAEKDKALGEKAAALKEHEVSSKKFEEEIVLLNQQKIDVSNRANRAIQTMQGFSDKFNAQSKKLQELEDSNKKLEQDLTRVKKEYEQANALQARVSDLEKELREKNTELDALKKQQVVEIKEALPQVRPVLLSSASVIHGINDNVLPLPVVDLPDPIIQELEQDYGNLENTLHETSGTNFEKPNTKEENPVGLMQSVRDAGTAVTDLLDQIREKNFRLKSLNVGGRQHKINQYKKHVEKLVHMGHLGAAQKLVKEIESFIRKAQKALIAGNLDKLKDAEFDTVDTMSLIFAVKNGNFEKEILMRIQEHQVYLKSIQDAVETMQQARKKGNVHPYFITLIHQIALKDPFKVQENKLLMGKEQINLNFLNEFVNRISKEKIQNLDQLLAKSEEWKNKLSTEGQKFTRSDADEANAKKASGSVQNDEYNTLVLVFSRLETHLRHLNDLLITPEKMIELQAAAGTQANKFLLTNQFFPKMRAAWVSSDKSITPQIANSIEEIKNLDQLKELIHDAKESIYEHGYVQCLDNSQLRFFVKYLNQYGFQIPK